MCVAPVSSVFSSITGLLYDAEAERITLANVAAGVDADEDEASSQVCIGAGCFRTALQIAVVVCIVAMLLGVCRRRRAVASKPLKGRTQIPCSTTPSGTA